MSTRGRTQLTVRGIPASLDRALRQRARAGGKSVNQVVVEALAAELGVAGRTYDDLDFMIGTMSSADADRLDAAIAAQRSIDDDLWR